MTRRADPCRRGRCSAPPTPEPALGDRRIARLPHQLAPEALDFTLRPGETVRWAEAAAEPVFLIRLLDASCALCAVQVFFPLTFSNKLGAGHPQVTVTALGGRRQSPDPALERTGFELSVPALEASVRFGWEANAGADSTIQPAFLRCSCSACHSTEPTAQVVLTGRGLRRCSSSSARCRVASKMPQLGIGVLNQSRN